MAAVPVCPPFRDRSRGGREVGAVPPVAGDCRERGCAAVDSGVRRFRGGVCDRTARGGGPAGYARGRRGVVARRVAAVPVCPPFRDREAERAGPAERTPAHSVCRSHCRGNREGDRLSRKAIRPGSPFHGGFVPAFGGRIIPMKRIANWNLKTIKL